MTSPTLYSLVTVHCCKFYKRTNSQFPVLPTYGFAQRTAGQQSRRSSVQQTTLGEDIDINSNVQN